MMTDTPLLILGAIIKSESLKKYDEDINEAVNMKNSIILKKFIILGLFFVTSSFGTNVYFYCTCVPPEGSNKCTCDDRKHGAPNPMDGHSPSVKIGPLATDDIALYCMGKVAKYTGCSRSTYSYSHSNNITCTIPIYGTSDISFMCTNWDVTSSTLHMNSYNCYSTKC